jgi:foldase protein PrsA
MKRLALVLFAALFALLFVGFAIAQGIGEPSVPSGDVALVKGVPGDVGHISEAKFKRTVLQQASQGGLKKLPKEGSSKYEELKKAAMSEVLNAVWLRGEAEELGISVTKKQIETELEQIKKTNFKTEKAFQEFLKKSHFTPEEVNEKVELNLLSTRIQEQVQSEAPPASSSQVSAYYEEEKAAQYTVKPSRDIRLIFSKSKAEVEKAKEELEKDHSPTGWKKVAPKRSEDPSTKTKGGLQKEVTEEFVKGDLKKAIFDSATGELVGPVKYEKNYLLIEVVKLNPEKVKPLSEVKNQISTTLTQQVQQEFFSEFVSSFQAKWTSRSFCASGYVVEQCANYVGSGHPSTASPACYEANPKTPPTECPAPVAMISPALPGTVTVVKPKGEPFPQRPRPEATAASSEGSEALPEGVEAAPEGTEAAPEGTEAAPESSETTPESGESGSKSGK